MHISIFYISEVSKLKKKEFSLSSASALYLWGEADRDKSKE
jgi:hypothetical protein